jgi:hypothetical protein
MRNEYCLEHIEQVIENCGLSDRQVRELRQTTKFRASHGEISPLSNGAIMPLIRVKDPEIQAKTIDAVVKELGTKGDRVTAKEVEAIIEQLKPAGSVTVEQPEVVAPEAAPVIESEPVVTTPEPKKPIEAIQEAIETLFAEGLGADQVKEILREAFNYVWVRVSQESQPTAQVASEVATIPEQVVVEAAPTEPTPTALADRMVANYVTAKAVPKVVHKKRKPAAKVATSTSETKNPLSPVVAAAPVAATGCRGNACNMIGRWSR